MPRGRSIRPPKLFIPGLLGGVAVGGAVGGLLYHIIDPPGWVVMAIEALIAVAVVALLLLPSPQTPNLNPIIQLIDAHAV